MLKIKDNVSLQELEKFLINKKYDFTYLPSSQKYQIVICYGILVQINNYGEIYTLAKDGLCIDELVDFIFELTQAKLVEKTM